MEEPNEEVEKKAEELAKILRIRGQHVVCYTGAGISTSANIPGTLPHLSYLSPPLPPSLLSPLSLPLPVPSTCYSSIMFLNANGDWQITEDHKDFGRCARRDNTLIRA